VLCVHTTLCLPAIQYGLLPFKGSHACTQVCILCCAVLCYAVLYCELPY
jgi:hypothetical protein